MALGVKMNILLFLPGLLVLLVQYRGMAQTFRHTAEIGLIQVRLSAQPTFTLAYSHVYWDVLLILRSSFQPHSSSPPDLMLLPTSHPPLTYLESSCTNGQSTGG